MRRQVVVPCATLLRSQVVVRFATLLLTLILVAGCPPGSPAVPVPPGVVTPGSSGLVRPGGSDDPAGEPVEPSVIAPVTSRRRVQVAPPAPPPATVPSTSTPSTTPSTALASPDDPTATGDPLPSKLDHPDGVPFPLPDPLPPESSPREPVDAPGPHAGPAPLAYWVGGPGETDGRFNSPRALVAAPDGRSVVVVDKTGRLQRFDHEGRLVRLVRTPAIGQGKPTGLGVGADGELFVADTHYARVLVYGPDLALRRVWGAPGRAPGLFMFMAEVKPGPDGRLYTLDYGDDVARLQMFEPAATRPRLAWASGRFGVEVGELRRPMSLCLDRERPDIYVADAVNHRIVVFGADGAWKRVLAGPGTDPGQLGFPYDIVQDERGRLWIAEFGNQRISVLDRDTGACLGTWGEAGRRLGALSRPWGVALGADDRVWVIDTENSRLYALPRSAVLSP